MPDETELIPDNHVVTVSGRYISVDEPQLIQNNVNTDTITLELDGEWDGVDVLINLGVDDLGEEAIAQLIWTGEPVTIPSQCTTEVGYLPMSVVGYGDDGLQLVTAASDRAFEVVESGLVDSLDSEEYESILSQIVGALEQTEEAISACNQANTAAQEAITACEEATSAANDATTDAKSAAETATSAAETATSAATTAQEAADAATSAAAEAKEIAESAAAEAKEIAEAAAETANTAAEAANTAAQTATDAISGLDDIIAQAEEAITNCNQATEDANTAASQAADAAQQALEAAEKALEAASVSGEDVVELEERVAAIESTIDGLAGNLDVGGTQLFPGTKNFSAAQYAISYEYFGWSPSSYFDLSVDDEGFTVAHYNSPDDSRAYHNLRSPVIPYSKVRNKTVTFSMECRGAMSDGEDRIGVNICTTSSTTSATRASYYNALRVTELGDDWEKLSATVEVTDDVFVSGTAPDDLDSAGFMVQIYRYALTDGDIRKPKLELGAVATDWSPAPEDDSERALTNYARTDLNEILEPGTYIVNANSVADTPSGLDGTYARLTVAYSYSSEYLVQKLYGFDEGKTWTRSYDGSWSDWVAYATADDLEELSSEKAYGSVSDGVLTLAAPSGGMPNIEIDTEGITYNYTASAGAVTAHLPWFSDSDSGLELYTLNDLELETSPSITNVYIDNEDETSDLTQTLVSIADLVKFAELETGVYCAVATTSSYTGKELVAFYSDSAAIVSSALGLVKVEIQLFETQQQQGITLCGSLPVSMDVLNSAGDDTANLSTAYQMSGGGTGTLSFYTNSDGAIMARVTGAARGISGNNPFSFGFKIY